MKDRTLNIDQYELGRLKWRLRLLNFEFFFGVLLIILSTTGSYVIVNSYDSESIIMNWKESFKVKGTITKVEKINFADNDVPIYENTYEYQIENSVLAGRSYSTGQKFESGDKVVILVQSNDETISKISGQRSSSFSLFALGVLVFPLIGLYIIFRGITGGNKVYSIISNGVITAAESRKRSKVIDDETVKNFLFYTDIHSNKHRLTDYKEKDTDEGHVEIIYMRSNPELAFILDLNDLFGNYKRIKKLVTNAETP